MSTEEGQLKFQKILTDMFVAAAEEETAASDDAKDTSGDKTTKSSSSGCNAGFAPILLLLAACVFPVFRKL